MLQHQQQLRQKALIQMNEPVVTFLLYVWLTLFLVVNAVSILLGIDVLVGVEMGPLALVMFAAPGIVAGLASRQEAEPAEKAAK